MVNSLDSLIPLVIENLFIRAGCSESFIKYYMDQTDHLIFSTTGERKYLTRNSLAGKFLKGNSKDIDLSLLLQSRVTTLFNDRPRKSFEYKSPNEGLRAFAEELVQKEGIETHKVVELDISLKLDKMPDVFRRVQVPADYSLNDLHMVIQIIFMWEEAHLFEFELRDRTRIVGTKEDYDMAMEFALMKETILIGEELTLEEIAENEKSFNYIYDMGDYWVHQITVKKQIESSEAAIPKLIKMRGDAIPEDVGSSHGYAAFKEVIDNPNHENFEATMEWANYYFDLLKENDSVEKVNERLVLEFE